MKNYGLIGQSLKHSFSKTYFAEKFEKLGLKCSYELFELQDLDRLKSLIDTKELCGLNVTIPYKEKIIPYLDQISPEAQEIQAVNTIKIENGQMFGFNTDYYGFKKSLLSFIKKKRPKALILGSGGASKAVRKVLDDLDIFYKIVSRKNGENLTYDELNNAVLNDHHLIINTTPLGMFPNINEFPPINFQYINNQHFCFDLIYNPDETLFLNKANLSGAKIMNGLEMLYSQAEKSWEIWNS